MPVVVNVICSKSFGKNWQPDCCRMGQPDGIKPILLLFYPRLTPPSPARAIRLVELAWNNPWQRWNFAAIFDGRCILSIGCKTFYSGVDKNSKRLNNSIPALKPIVKVFFRCKHLIAVQIDITGWSWSVEGRQTYEPPSIPICSYLF